MHICLPITIFITQLTSRLYYLIAALILTFFKQVQAQKMNLLEQAANGKLSPIIDPADWIPGKSIDKNKHNLKGILTPFYLEAIY